MNWVYILSMINVFYEFECWCNFWGFFNISVRCNIKIYCFEINVDIRLYRWLNVMGMIGIF